MSDTPTPRTDAILALIPGGQTCDPQLVADELRPKIAELERELAACVPGMEMISKMLSDERALADRLADQLKTCSYRYDPRGAQVTLDEWKASRNPTPAEIDAHLDECAARSERDWKPLEGDAE